MRFTINKADLIRELSLINGIVEKRSTIAILSNMYIKAEGQLLYLKGTDLEVGLTVALKADIEEDGVVIVSAKKFFEIVRVLPDGDITFWIEDEWLKIEKGQSFYSINAQVDDNYPIIPDYDFSFNIVKLPKGPISDVISTVSVSINTEMIKERALNGAFFEFYDNEINIVTSNRHTLFVASTALEQTEEIENTNFILSKKTFLELKKMIQHAKESDMLLMGRDGTNIFFQAGSRVLFSRLVNQSFVDYRSFFTDQEQLTELLLKVAHIKDIIKELQPLSGQFSKKIIFEFDQGNIIASLQDIEGSVGIVRKPLQYKGKYFKLGYNIEYLSSFFNVVDVEEVRALMDTTGEKAANFLFTKNGVDYTFLINPLILE
ncbi:MAG: DNA polymerase III subunit beta [Acidobacteria bacterium CG_4_9_14_3_um_filter_49_7]|nr:MAG: DNA polymerase III subunit beta [Acidobacteria bacterium CG_4_9_14_3_um_filter_49_7]